MSKRVRDAKGGIHVFPDDATEEEVNSVLDAAESGTPGQEAAAPSPDASPAKPASPPLRGEEESGSFLPDIIRHPINTLGNELEGAIRTGIVDPVLRGAQVSQNLLGFMEPPEAQAASSANIERMIAENRRGKQLMGELPGGSRGELLGDVGDFVAGGAALKGLAPINRLSTAIQGIKSPVGGFLARVGGQAIPGGAAFSQTRPVEEGQTSLGNAEASIPGSVIGGSLGEALRVAAPQAASTPQDVVDLYRRLSPEARKGVDVAQLTGSPFLQGVQKLNRFIPGTGAQASADTQAALRARELSHLVGEDTPALTPDKLESVRDATQKAMTATMQGASVPFDAALKTDLTAIRDKIRLDPQSGTMGWIRKILGEEEENPAYKKAMQPILDLTKGMPKAKADPILLAHEQALQKAGITPTIVKTPPLYGDKMTGEQYIDAYKEIGGAIQKARSAATSDPNALDALVSLREALTDAVRRTNPSRMSALDPLRERYANVMSLKDVMTKSARPEIDEEALRREAFSRGGNESLRPHALAAGTFSHSEAPAPIVSRIATLGGGMLGLKLLGIPHVAMGAAGVIGTGRATNALLHANWLKELLMRDKPGFAEAGGYLSRAGQLAGPASQENN